MDETESFVPEGSIVNQQLSIGEKVEPTRRPPTRSDDEVRRPLSTSPSLRRQHWKRTIDRIAPHGKLARFTIVSTTAQPVKSLQATMPASAAVHVPTYPTGVGLPPGFRSFADGMSRTRLGTPLHSVPTPSSWFDKALNCREKLVDRVDQRIIVRVRHLGVVKHSVDQIPQKHINLIDSARGAHVDH